MRTVPQELNWVEKRVACSIGQVFKELRMGIANDLATLNTVLKLARENQFAARGSEDGAAIAVEQLGTLPRPCVWIKFMEDALEVRDEAKGKVWSAKAKLNPEGRCVLALEDGTELEQWQFRKKALEGLFFGD